MGVTYCNTISRRLQQYRYCQNHHHHHHHHNDNNTTENDRQLKYKYAFEINLIFSFKKQMSLSGNVRTLESLSISIYNNLWPGIYPVLHYQGTLLHLIDLVSMGVFLVIFINTKLIIPFVSFLSSDRSSYSSQNII